VDARSATRRSTCSAPADATWGSTRLLSEIDFEDIHYSPREAAPVDELGGRARRRSEATFDKLGIPEAERKFLAGVTAQYRESSITRSART
jgi:Fe-S cluster assembly protein SufB